MYGSNVGGGSIMEHGCMIDKKGRKWVINGYYIDEKGTPWTLMYLLDNWKKTKKTCKNSPESRYGNVAIRFFTRRTCRFN